MKVSGIYTITNKIDNKIYIGSSSDIKHRLSSHKSSLKYNKHINKHLQRSYNLYGLDNFIFEVLEECSIEYINSQEQYWINLLNVCNDKYGYNIRPIAESNRGIKRGPEEIERLRKLSTGNKYSLGIKRSKETKYKISENSNTRRPIVQLDFKGNIINEWRNAVDAASFFNVTKNAIYIMVGNKDYKKRKRLLSRIYKQKGKINKYNIKYKNEYNNK